MENATEALMMAFAVMILIIALTVGISSLTNAKQAADAILYMKDESNFYEYQGVKGKAAENRIVGLETIIPTLYKYYKENYTVVFKHGTYDYSTGEFSDLHYLTIYSSASNKKNWQKESYYNLMLDKYKVNETYAESGNIFSFDLDEETLRHEAWTGSYDRIKHNLDCFLNGKSYYNPNNNQLYITYKNFINDMKNYKFIETIEEYNSGNSQNSNLSGDRDSSIKGSAKDKSKRMIVFIRIDNK